MKVAVTERGNWRFRSQKPADGDLVLCSTQDASVEAQSSYQYQLTEVLNIEASFDKFVRGNNFQGLGQTFSIGLRALF